tara:strand:- start:53 stop:232 length:180 start_codon:yes stop_codon:yes gene_type:complete
MNKAYKSLLEKNKNKRKAFVSPFFEHFFWQRFEFVFDSPSYIKKKIEYQSQRFSFASNC